MSASVSASAAKINDFFNFNYSSDTGRDNSKV